MSSKDQILIDGRTAVHLGSDGCVNALQMYRKGTAVTARLNVSKVANAVSTSTTVSFFGCAAITTESYIENSEGDDDTDGGLSNGGLKGEATYFKTGSSQLLIGGNEAVRAFDLCEPNQGNGPLMPVIQAGGAPLGSALERIKLNDHQIDAASAESLIYLKLESCQPENRYGYIAVLSEDIASPEAVLVDPVPIGDRGIPQSTVPLVLPESIEAGTVVTAWLLEIDKVPAYTQKDRDVCPALGKNLAPYYPIPLSPLPIATQLKPKKDKSDSPIPIDVACIAVYPVQEYKQENAEKSWKLLPSGWLYLFMEGYLWREFKITTVSQGMPLYHFSEVNLITQQGRNWREASTQGRMDTILLPKEIQGKTVSISVAFSETQWPWARVISAGGMHPTDPRVLAHRQQASRDMPSAQSTDGDKPLVQPITEYPVATLHTEAESPYPVYTGPVLVVSA